MPSDDTMMLGLKISQTFIESKHTKGEVLKYKKYVDYRYLFAMSDLKKIICRLSFQFFAVFFAGHFRRTSREALKGLI